MKIAHFGTFDVENYGDLIFPLVLEHRLAGLGAEIVHFSPKGGAGIWKDCVASQPADSIFSQLDRFDGLIVGGGDIIQSPRTLDRFPEISSLLAYPSLWLGPAHAAASRGLPLCWNAPGVPSRFGEIEGRCAAWAASVADYLSVRDPASADILRELNVPQPVRIVPDTALDISRLWSAREIDDAYREAFGARNKSVPERSLAIHLNPHHAAGDPDVLAALVERIAARANAMPILLAICGWNDDRTLIEAVAKRLSIDALVITNPSSLREVAACIARSEAYLGSSLHGMITACAFGRRGLLVAPRKAVTNKKFRGFLESFSLEQWLFTSWQTAEAASAEFFNAPLKPWRDVAGEASLALDAHWKALEAQLRRGRTIHEKRATLNEWNTLASEFPRVRDIYSGLLVESAAKTLRDAKRHEEQIAARADQPEKHLLECIAEFEAEALQSRDEIEKLTAECATLNGLAASRRRIDSALQSLLDQLQEAVDRLYRSRRWKAANPLHALKAQLFQTRFHPPRYWRLDEALQSFKRFVAATPRLSADPADGRTLVRPCTPYDAHIRNNRLTPRVRAACVEALGKFAHRPRVSVLMPVHNVDVQWLRIAVDSVVAQIYPDWELCIADDASSRPELHAFLRDLASEPRIKLVFRPVCGHISEATNSAAELATGEFITLLDQDDVLAPNALFEIARLLQTHPDADVIYSDEDKIDENEQRYDPQFKPDWSPEFLLSYNYINHLTCIRRDLFEQAGRFRTGFEGAQDYDLLLRVTSRTPRIHHIPKVLYHWRALEGSMASCPRNKSHYSHSSVQRALMDHLAANAIDATAYVPAFAERLNLPINLLDGPDSGPRVAIIIPTHNQRKLLETCVDSIRTKTSYRNYEIIIVDNDSSERATLSYLARIDGVRVLRISNEGQPFSYSRVNNLAVRQLDAELILFLNNDTEIVEPRWLSRLVAYSRLPGVGAAGARLLFQNGTLQHGGIAMGIAHGIAPGHAFLNHHRDTVSYYFQAETARNCTAVTGACLLTRRALFLEIGGFDECYPVTMSDVDFCMRLRERNLRTVYVGGAELIHHESQTRSRYDDPAELGRFRQRHAESRDAFHNPNLLQTPDYEVDPGCHLDMGAVIGRPLRVLMATHNLNLGEGAPKSLAEIAIGLKQRSRIEPVIISPAPGAQAGIYREAGIKVRVQELETTAPPLVTQGWRSLEKYEASVKRIERIIEQENPDVVFANTLFSYHVVDAATRAGVPVVWVILESIPPGELQRSVNEFVLPHCEQAFIDAHTVVFVSNDTRDLYKRYDWRRNFTVIRNGLDRRAIDAFIAQTSKDEAAREIDIPAGKKMVLSVGTICERKDQQTLVAAAAILKRKRSDFGCCLVGLREELGYAKQIRQAIKENALGDVVRLIPETPNVFPYYRAADIFVLTSHVEAFALSVLEAEAFSLPVVSTPCCGIYEQVRPSVNARIFNMSDAGVLADHLAELLENDGERERMGANSRHVLDSLGTHFEMLSRYDDVITGAYSAGSR